MLTTLALPLALALQVDPHAPDATAPPVDAAALSRAAAAGHLPRGVSSFGAACAHGQVYAIGGYFGTPHDYHAGHQSRDFVRIDPVTGVVQQLPSTGPIQGSPLVATEHGLVQVGGLRIHNTAEEEQDLRSVDAVRVFDPIGEAWSDLPPLPMPRSSHDAIAVGNEIFVVGGWRLDGGSANATWLETMLSLDLDEDEPRWREHPQPFQVRALALATDGEHLLAVGGIAPDGLTNAAWVYAVGSAAWSEAPSFPGSAFGASAVGTDDGFVASGRDGVLRRWREGADTWTDDSRLWYPRFFHRLVRTDAGDVIALGGINAGGRPTLVERFTPGDDGPASIEQSVPSPMAARGRQALATVRGDLLLVGGNNGVEQHDFAPERFESATWRFDPTERRWERLADAPAPRQSAKLVALGRDTLALVGGFAHDGEVARAHDQVWTYDLAADTWDQGSPPLPMALTQFGLARAGGRDFVAGGSSFDPEREDSFAVSDAILVADVDAQDYAFAVTEHVLPEPRRAHALGAWGDELFVVGGMGDGFAALESCHALDLASGRWRAIATPPLGCRFGAALIPVGDRLFLVGGTLADRRGRARDIEVYDPAQDTWAVLEARIPFAQSRLLATTYEGQLLVASAQETAGRMRFALVDVDRVRPAATAVEASAAAE